MWIPGQYMKRSLDFSSGNLDEILHRVSSIVFQEMIYEFLRGSVSCQEQTGEAVIFKRRHPSQSEIPAGLLHRQIYDYIRMLDGGMSYCLCEGWTGNIYFRNAV